MEPQWDLSSDAIDCTRPKISADHVQENFLQTTGNSTCPWMSANLRHTSLLRSTESPWRCVFTAESVSEQQGWALPLKAVLEDSPFAICQGQEAQHPTAGRHGATFLPHCSAPMSARATQATPQAKPREVAGQQEWVARWDRHKISPGLSSLSHYNLITDTS